MVKIEMDLVSPEYGFEAKDEAGVIGRFDNSPDDGGTNFGIRPMQSVLMALGSCSGIDVISILKKKRLNLTGYKMIISGEREKNKVPALWETVHVTFLLKGDMDEEKAKHAISLSIEKYCSVAETLRRGGCTITWDLKLNEE